MENQASELIQFLKTRKDDVKFFKTLTNQERGFFYVEVGFREGPIFDLQIKIEETTTIETVKALLEESPEAVARRTSEFRELFKMCSGKRYTLASMGEFGFCHSVQFTLERITVGKFAQYNDCINLIIKPKGARNLRSIKFYGRKVFALWADWVPVNTDAFGPSTNEGNVTVSRSRYLSCDEQFLKDAIASVNQKPLIVRL